MTTRAILAAIGLFLGFAGLGSARATAPVEIPDPVGDAGCCVPDISHVRVSNDAKGVLTVTARIANRPQFQPGDYIDLYFDPAPDASGDGYAFAVEYDGRETSFWVAGDDDWYEAPTIFSDFDVSYDGSTVTFRVNPDDVEIAGPFRLIVSTQNESVPDAFDDAPAEPGLRHQLDAPPLSVLEDPKPSVPRAGESWAVTMKVRGATSSGRVTCSATMGKRKLSARADWFRITIVMSNAGITLERVRPRCFLTIPKRTRGKVVKATLAVTQHGTTVRRTTQMRVR